MSRAALSFVVLLGGLISATPASAQSPVVAAAGDIACDPDSRYFNRGYGTSTRCHMRQTAAVVSNIRPSRVLPLGDTQYEHGVYSEYLESYNRTWGAFRSLTRPAVGNHEYVTRNAAGYFRYFGSRAGPRDRGYYSFDLGGWRLIALNSQCDEVGGCAVGSPQYRWLARDLAEHPRKCTLAYMHHPRFSSGNERGNQPNLKNFWRLLHRKRTEAVLAGHEHDYERFAPQDADGRRDSTGPTQFVVGTGGKNLRGWGTLKPNTVVRNNRTHGVLKLRLDPGGAAWRFRPERGATFTDTGYRRCR